MAQPNSLPRVLVSNDDGIDAPGLRRLVQLLGASAICSVHVCAPAGERSAQSHAITMARHLSCSPVEVDGAVEAWAVDGTPADSVMLALNSPVFKGPRFDLVASGINRGDNCGLHVIYSGTVGAAREAACKSVPAVAFSLADHRAKQLADYDTPAALAVHVIQALLASLASGCEHAGRTWAAGHVLNVNYPAASLGPPKGFAVTQQGTGCLFPRFLEVSEPKGPHLPEFEEHTQPVRLFRNYAGDFREDEGEGTDNLAVKQGWVSVTPLSLRSDVQLRLDTACSISYSARRVTAGIVAAAAAAAQLPTRGLAEETEAAAAAGAAGGS